MANARARGGVRVSEADGVGEGVTLARVAEACLEGVTPRDDYVKVRVASGEINGDGGTNPSSGLPSGLESPHQGGRDTLPSMLREMGI